MVRTRTDAAALTTAGFLRLNGKRMTAAAHPVRVGDVVTLALDRSVRVLRVEGICGRRGGAPAARALYRDLTTSSGTPLRFRGPAGPDSGADCGTQGGCGLSAITLGSVR
jgi:ribosome-associated heat shock protein Hsp15